MAEGTGTAPALRLTPVEIQQLLENSISVVDGIRLVSVEADALIFAVAAHALSQRQGGTVSGPALFAAMDVAAYATVNGYVGHVPTATLSSCSVEFLEAVRPAPLTVQVRLLRLGMRKAVMCAEVTGDGVLVAVATLQFAVPARAARTALAAVD
ncbi:PaaI family thioesterase [Micromonospora sp. DT53]|uniref:PaaI family thioesterase n=1 Tax=Micromonospora sp. DT53 TaxID=3393444 RepID=UPI003CF8BF4D